MGCLNNDVGFDYWFGNIHLSGPCNRSCYFCIGQHMMRLDPMNVLDSWPLPGLDDFIAECRRRDVRAVYVTGTNTDPLLYRYHGWLVNQLRRGLDVPIGIRTNGVALPSAWQSWELYDRASLTVCSFDQAIARSMMGGPPISASVIARCVDLGRPTISVNIVLGPENSGEDLWRTLDRLEHVGIVRVNLREPYGQPHVGNPLAHCAPVASVHGAPTYAVAGLRVTYWDVHFVEVESVNLYADGRISVTYPITKGHADDGKALPQNAFPGGRVRAQWIGSRHA